MAGYCWNGRGFCVYSTVLATGWLTLVWISPCRVPVPTYDSRTPILPNCRSMVTLYWREYGMRRSFLKAPGSDTVVRAAVVDGNTCGSVTGLVVELVWLGSFTTKGVPAVVTTVGTMS